MENKLEIALKEMKLTWYQKLRVKLTLIDQEKLSLSEYIDQVNEKIIDLQLGIYQSKAAIPAPDNAEVKFKGNEI